MFFWSKNIIDITCYDFSTGYTYTRWCILYISFIYHLSCFMFFVLRWGPTHVLPPKDNIYIYMYINMCIYMGVCMYIYTNIGHGSQENMNHEAKKQWFVEHNNMQCNINNFYVWFLLPFENWMPSKSVKINMFGEFLLLGNISGIYSSLNSFSLCHSSINLFVTICV